MVTVLRYLRVVALLCLIAFANTAALCQTTLTAGDIAVLGFNSDVPPNYPGRQWAFMTMVNLSAGTQIIFTDNGYDGSTGQFRSAAGNTSDGFLTWTVQSPITKGTIIYATNSTVNGTTTGVSGQLGVTSGFSTGGDQIIVYQGTSGTATSATFIYALNTGQSSTAYAGGIGTWQTSGSVTVDNQSWKPPTLTSTTAVPLTTNINSGSSGTGALGTSNYGFDNMYYAGTMSGTKTQLLTAIATPGNWKGDNTTVWNIAPAGVYSNNNFTILPVALLYFTAQTQGAETVQLKWGTAVESNNDHFIIERSDDGVSFSPVCTIPGRNNYSLEANYTFTDKAPLQGNNYYRLSQTDIDGQTKILGIRTVTVESVSLRISPNPARDVIDATFNMGEWNEIKLFNGEGRLLQTVHLLNSIRRVHFLLTSYSNGTYFMAFIGNNRKRNLVKKFVKL